MKEKDFMKIAIEEASKGLRNNEGGPFGAVIVKDGVVIAQAHNEVVKLHDPTAHAEILAIRKASSKLKNFELEDCEIYSTCEPCPMCFAAIHWARIRKLYYGCNREDAGSIGFDDDFIYNVLEGKAKRSWFEMDSIGREECLKLFEEWQKKEDKTRY
ncbi:MAG: nucleoside deaminase [bacterium]|nr:nucleoside deaminase [bacterium]